MDWVCSGVAILLRSRCAIGITHLPSKMVDDGTKEVWESYHVVIALSIILISPRYYLQITTQCDLACAHPCLRKKFSLRRLLREREHITWMWGVLARVQSIWPLQNRKEKMTEHRIETQWWSSTIISKIFSSTKGCLHINKLTDVDTAVLKKMMEDKSWGVPSHILLKYPHACSRSESSIHLSPTSSR